MIPLLAGVLLAAVVGASPASAGELTRPVGGALLGSSGIVVAPGSPPLPDIKAAGWLVADLDTGEVLAARDPHGRYAPASTLKTLTALALIPRLSRDRLVTPTFDDINIEGSRVGLVQEVAYPVSELFSALLMVSGNDAANVLASAAGGQQRAAALMNDRATELGALDTLAVNQHGLDAPGQVSSPYDLALITRAGLVDPDFARYLSIRQTTVAAPGGQRMEIASKNKLLRGYDGTLGGKNGYTNAARASYVGAAERDGRRLVVSLMKADPKVFDEAASLLDWGFSARAAQPVGVLVQPEGAVVAAAPDAGTDASLSTAGGAAGSTAAGPASSSTPSLAAAASAGDGTSLPVTLAGLALAVGAVATVRNSPGGPGRRAAPVARTVRPRREATVTRFAPRQATAVHLETVHLETVQPDRVAARG